MTPEDSARLGGLLLGQRLVALGVVAEGEPIVGLLPYAVSADRTALIVQSSSLARHSKGLLPGAPWSGLIHEPDSAETDPLQVARLQIEGIVDPVRGERPEFQPLARTFLARFPQAARTLRCRTSPSSTGDPQRQAGAGLRQGPQPVGGPLPRPRKGLRAAYNPDPVTALATDTPGQGERGQEWTSR